MAVILVSDTDSGGTTVRWKVPHDNALNQSQTPRGLRSYGGTKAVLALGTGDQTNVQIQFIFPEQFVYLCKSLTIGFQSDDLTTEFSNQGSLVYRPKNNVSLGIRREYTLECAGASFQAATNSIQTYHPVGTWRHWIDGKQNDRLWMYLADISGDASTAGDISWTADFWEFDIEQCMQYPINTPAQTVTY